MSRPLNVVDCDARELCVESIRPVPLRQLGEFIHGRSKPIEYISGNNLNGRLLRTAIERHLGCRYSPLA